MTEGMKSEISRRAAAAVTRRHSILTFGGAVTAAVAVPALAEAGKAGKKARKRCKRQRKACRQSVEEFCGGDETCLQDLLPCCDPLGKCRAAASTDCFLSFLAN